MTHAPWSTRSGAGESARPAEELQATLDAIASSDLNCFSFLDPERALATARQADLTKPFGGVPVGIKELEQVQGWPDTGASLVFKDQVASFTSETTRRFIEDGGANPVGLTTASEFGGLNVSVTKLNGVCHNPWRYGRTVGGSSGGSASAVAGGLVSIASGGDGGGSIRIPAGYTGLFGMKGTFGRMSRGSARVLASEHGRQRLPGPLGARRGAPLRRLRRRRPPATRPASPIRAAGSATSARPS